MTRVCWRCKVNRPLTDYSIDRRRKLGRNYTCKPCNREMTREYRKKHPERNKKTKRRVHLRQRYGLTPEAYDAMLSEQRGVCAICKRTQDGRNLSVDHCHTTGVIRGLLCEKCNFAIGLLGDSPEVIVAALSYLTVGVSSTELRSDAA